METERERQGAMGGTGDQVQKGQRPWKQTQRESQLCRDQHREREKLSRETWARVHSPSRQPAPAVGRQSLSSPRHHITVASADT